MAQAETDVRTSESALYRVLCLTCGGEPAYKGADLETAERTLRSLRPDGHDIRLQRAHLAWEDVDRAGEERD